MQQYIIRRVLLAIPTIIGITILIFMVLRVLPGDPLEQVFSEEQGLMVLSDEELAYARQTLGLDKPLYLQYLIWTGQVLRFEFGTSFWTDDPIGNLIKRSAPITLEIAIVAILLSWLVGIPVGIIGAVWRNTFVDYSSRFFVTMFLAIPSFWLGMMFILVSVLYFSWKPPITIIQLWEDPLQNLTIVAGPAIAVGLGMAAFTARMARSSMLEVYREDYVRTARAKGAGEKQITFRHVLKNALLPVITVTGLQLAGLLGGSVAVERAFAVPGLGLALTQGIADRDWNIIQALVFLYAVVFVFVNLIVDLSYAWVDPRIRYK